MQISNHAKDKLAINGDLRPPDHDVAALAYHLWIQRGCPIGSPDDDWFQAEAQLEAKSIIPTDAQMISAPVAFDPNGNGRDPIPPVRHAARGLLS